MPNETLLIRRLRYLLDTNILLAYVRWQALARYKAKMPVTSATILTTDKDFDHLHPQVVTREYINPNSRL